MIYEYIYKSKIGNIYITADDETLLSVKFDNKKSASSTVLSIDTLEQNKVIKDTVLQLGEYFSGKRKVFELPLKLIGTEFQKKVWKELMNIPYGQTRTYKEIAVLVNNPNACRAVGNANNKNPISIIVPCHRVIGTNGKLVGYAGGKDVKKRLLEYEKCPNKISR